MAKFVAIDANGLNVLFSGNDLSFINLHCKTENPPKQAKKTINFSQDDFLASQVIVLSSFCTPQFQFEPFSWEMNNPEPSEVFNEHFSSRLSYLYLDNASPPPRMA